MPQSAAELAASFVVPTPITQPIPIPLPAQQPGTTTHLAAQINAALPGTPGDLAFTPNPLPNGFPPVLFTEPEGILYGLPQERIDALSNGVAGPSLAVIVHNSGFPPQHEVRALTAAITAAIRRITGEANPLVIPPEREWGVAVNRSLSPYTWIITNISEASVALALQRMAWSAPSVSLHVGLPVISIGRLMFLLGGFAHDRNGTILSAVFTVFSGDIIFPIILDLVQANPAFANVRPEDAARAILASIEVRVSTLQNGNIMVAVFCDSPTQSIPHWRAWRDRVASLPFPHPLNSTGTVRRPSACAGCHGCDHPTHLCPYQNFPGWNAPPPGTTWAQPGAGQTGAATGGGAPPPPPPPPNGGSANRSRTQSGRRNNSQPDYFQLGPRRDQRGGGSGPGSGGNKGASIF